MKSKLNTILPLALGGNYEKPKKSLRKQSRITS